MVQISDILLILPLIAILLSCSKCVTGELILNFGSITVGYSISGGIVMGEHQHQSLAAGRWASFSLAEQLGNIGSEVSRAIRARGDEKRFEGAVLRAFELFDLTINDRRWQMRLKELTRARELFCDAISGGVEYGTSLEDLDKYFYYFAFASRSST